MWNWQDICSYEQIPTPDDQNNDISVCFLQLYLQIPVLVVLSIFSAYYCGRWQRNWRRDKCSVYTINFRILTAICLGLLPILKSYIFLSEAKVVHVKPLDIFLNETFFRDMDGQPMGQPIDYLVAATEGTTWIIHLCFLICLRLGGGENSRGPVSIRLLILFLFGISVLLLKDENAKITSTTMGINISHVVSLFFYCLTMVPGTISRERRGFSPFREVNESSALINSPSSTYVTFSEQQDLYYLGIAMDGNNFISKLLFLWISPLMKKGSKNLLKHTDDLYELPEQISTAAIKFKINKQFQSLSVQRGGPTEVPSPERILATQHLSLLRLLHKCFGWQFYSVGILKLLADLSGFMGPLLLNRFIGFIEDADKPISIGYAYAASMFFVALIGALLNTQFTFWMSVVGLKIRSSIITLVYTKVVQLSSTKLNKEFTTGEITNFMSTDSDRIVNSCASFHTFWSIPFQIAITMYLLHQQIGISFLAGVVFTIVLIPINKLIANKIGQFSEKMMASKDKRVRVMSETLRGIRTIKLHVWEKYFLKNIIEFREEELKYLRKRKYLDAMCVYFWATTPIIVSLLTFTMYTLLGHTMDTRTVFTTMALLNMLIGPLNMFPWVLNGLTEAWVSIKRVQCLFNMPDVGFANRKNVVPDVDIVFTNVKFDTANVDDEDTSTTEIDRFASPKTSRRTQNVFPLKNMSFNISKGQLVAVMGKVGSGKSLLLNVILGEDNKLKEEISVHNIDGGIGYVGQNPWVQRGTIRDNILFGKIYDSIKYIGVIKACALYEDLNAFPKRDMTGVSELGNTLSGGQRARIALARAVYADKEIYILDDVLSKLDANVANHVFHHVIIGLLKQKTRIFTSHQTKYLVHADTVVHMSEGRITKIGSPSEVLANIEDYLLSPDSLESSEKSPAFENMMLNSMDADDDTDSLLDEEIKEKGSIKMNVVCVYLNAVGKILLVLIFLSIFTMQLTRNLTDLWLSHWVNTANETAGNTSLPLNVDFGVDNIEYNLIVYGIMASSSSVFTLVRAFIFAYGGIKAARVLHEKLLNRMISSKVLFFDLQPFGRILNRFSSDTYTADDTLPFIANILCAQTFGLLGTIAVTTFTLPWTILIVTALAPFYVSVQNQYRLTSRELKRLCSTNLSPLYNHFSETIQGLTSIRAFRMVPKFKQDNEMYLESSQKSQFASIAATQWLSIRLQLIGAVLMGTICLVAVMQFQFRAANPGLIGLAITYVLSISSLLSGVVNSFTETEREMVAIERINDYLVNTPAENCGGDSPPYAWPSQGVVEFKNVVLKYRENIPPSLNGITFITRPIEKIGIVGRTGAGKSSLFSSLFRLTEISSGEIFVDNVNISRLQLGTLRSRMAMIPQNTFLFYGTVRENIDPLNKHPDLQIKKALEKCQLMDLVSRLGGLDAVIEEDGSNVSEGEKQLFCLARAVLQNAKIICIDEATANIDNETDQIIQSTIKSAFRSATILIIAHRVRSVMHCDRVMVLKGGEIVEFEEPDVLLQDPTSAFYSLVSHDFPEMMS